MKEQKKSESELAEISISSTISESMAYNEERRMRRFAKWYSNLKVAESVVQLSPHPFVVMSDAEIRALGNDVY